MTESKRETPFFVKLTIASLAGLSGLIVSYPFKLLKTRMQIINEGGGRGERIAAWKETRSIIREQGAPGLYTGFMASLVRQTIYAGVRIGLFQVLIDLHARKHDGKIPDLPIKMAIGSFTGALGVVAGLPFDIAVVRMMLDRRRPLSERRGYRSMFQTMEMVVREEGVLALWRGMGPAVCRAVAVNISVLVSYMECKQKMNMSSPTENNATSTGRDSLTPFFICGVVVSFSATICTLPFDIAKTRLQNMEVVGGKRTYKDFLHVWYVIVTKEGFLSLWKGFTPYVIKNVPQTLTFFYVYEKLYNLYYTFT